MYYYNDKYFDRLFYMWLSDYRPDVYRYLEGLKATKKEADDQGYFIQLSHDESMEKLAREAFEEYQMSICALTHRSTPYKRLLEQSRELSSRMKYLILANILTILLLLYLLWRTRGIG